MREEVIMRRVLLPLRLEYFRSLVFLFLVFSLREALGQQVLTLADVLKENSLPSPPISIPHLRSPITGYAVRNDHHEFLIAYYLVTREKARQSPLFLVGFDKHTGKWRHLPLLLPPPLPLNDLPGEAPQHTGKERSECIGSVSNIERNGPWYYLNLHWNPSTGCLVILKHDLAISQTLPGWTAAFFRSGTLVYSGNMVHFADVHPETLSVYEPATRKSQELYPQRDDALRRDFSTRLARTIDPKICAEKNWGCRPDHFTSVIDALALNERTHSVGFTVTFGTEGFPAREAAASDGKVDNNQYLYLYQLNPLRWRAFPIRDLQPKFGTDSLTDLLTPTTLHQVFATPPQQ